jgi:hypothetical protein
MRTRRFMRELSGPLVAVAGVLVTIAIMVALAPRRRPAIEGFADGYRVQMTIAASGVGDSENKAYEELRTRLAGKNVDVGQYDKNTPEGRDVVSRFGVRSFPDLRLLKGADTVAVFRPWTGAALMAWTMREIAESERGAKGQRKRPPPPPLRPAPPPPPP